MKDLKSFLDGLSGAKASARPLVNLVGESKEAGTDDGYQDANSLAYADVLAQGKERECCLDSRVGIED